MAVAAAIKVGQELTEDDLIVVLIPDSGRGYLSRVYNDEWMATYGFVRECELCVGAVLDARSEELPALLYVNPEQTVREAVSLMRRTGVSQLPVCKNEPPSRPPRSPAPSTSWRSWTPRSATPPCSTRPSRR